MSSKQLIKHLGNFQHLQDLQDFNKTFLVLVYSHACAPCKLLKPALLKKIQESNIELYTISRTQDENVNIYLEVGKIPHVAVIKNGERRGSIQNSNIDTTWSFVEEALADFTLNEDF